MKRITLPILEPNRLTAGETVLLSGTIYTARDAAHKRMVAMLAAGEPMPFEFGGACVYYAGPCPAKPGEVIGAVGPTTSGRMDAYSPNLIRHGLRFMIGKGERSCAVVEQIKAHKGIYFAAIGGAGALYAACTKSASLVAFEDLGAEAIYALEVEDMPLVVAIDSSGNNILVC